ncbi:hypothetical protein EST38_g7377 [Candolleomyces aberdarensis]|uniref:Peptidase C14 caspase domain-containing protein n=1 Tax=Candolleomyces aberdarensis TaxID=2316362 RepID=A0A4Q2DFS5_9AGAR|nr:hypothetical protein EST38_g7377 [Candolleomyces aberdarensis]
MTLSPTGSRLFALIIGIDDYTQEPEFRKLNGAVHDADSIRNWLIKDFNVPSSQIRDLRDKAATRKAIVEALEGLSTDSRIQRDDPILIYYAGHGTEAPAPKRWRWDSLQIQMIVPWDFKHRDGPNRTIQGIPDRTLGALLTKIAESKGDNIVRFYLHLFVLWHSSDLDQTVIFDSCHSGSGTRSESDRDTRVRGGPHEGDVPPDLDDDIVRSTGSTRGIRVPDKFRHHGLRSHVLLAACAPHEQAHESGSSGAFTKTLLGALNGANTTQLTYEGLIERMETLKTKVANTKPILHVAVRGENLVISGAGAIHGISTGSKFAIWRSPDDLKLEEKPLATVVVETVNGHDSVAPAPIEIEDEPSVTQLVAQLLENPRPSLSLYVPQAIQNMECFGTVFSKETKRPPLSIMVTEEKAKARVGLVYLDERTIGFEILSDAEQGQKIRHTIEPNADHLHRALDHLCRYYHHLDRVNKIVVTLGPDKIPFSSKFTLDVFTLQGNEEDIYVQSGPNLNVLGTGVELTVGPHNKEDLYGFKITNHTKLNVYPYLFYFDSSNFSITALYQPTAIQKGAEARPAPSMSGGDSLAIGYGSEGATPQNMALSSDNIDLERGYFRLYVSTHYVDISSMEQGDISVQLPARGLTKATLRRPHIWDAITVPVVMKRGTRQTPLRTIGIVGSRGNGKATFIEELAKSLYGNAVTALQTSFSTRFIKEYNITLSRPGGKSTTFTLVNLPAFEDSNVSVNSLVLKDMVAYLGTEYQKGRKFSSLIWCYDISKPRFTALDWENVELVKDICGPDIFGSIVVVTTNWNKGAGAAQRYAKAEAQLKGLLNEFKEIDFRRFGRFSNSEARERMLGSTPATDPLELIQSLLRKPPKALQVQTEAVDTKKLGGTTAGKRLRVKIEAEIRKQGEEIRYLEGRLSNVGENDTERNTIQEEKEDVKQDIIRLSETLENMEVINSALTV